MKGFIFTAYPTLMTQDESAGVMDKIFSCGGVDSRAQVLRIMHNFLTAEIVKHSAAEKGEPDTISSTSF